VGFNHWHSFIANRLASSIKRKSKFVRLATVATTGAYSDLSGKPTLGTASTHATGDFVLSTTTVNGHALSANVTVTASDVGAPSGSGTSSGTNTGDQDLTGLVTKTTTVNGHALSANVTVTASDVGLGSVTNDAQLKIASNLSDVNNAATARSNLGVAAVGGSYLGDTQTGAQTSTLVEYAPYAFTINSLKNLGTVSDTATGTLKINGTVVTGCSSLSLTSTPQNVTASGANSVSVGNTITFVTTSPSSLTGLLPFSLIGTR